MKAHDPENLKKDLATVAVWRVSQNAAWLGVSPIFYRRHIMPLPNHPTPLDSSAARLLGCSVVILGRRNARVFI